MNRSLLIQVLGVILALASAVGGQTQPAESSPTSHPTDLVASFRYPGAMFDRGGYTISLFANGYVVFEGRAADPFGSICREGRHVGRVPMSRRCEIERTFLEAGYLDYKDAYDDQRMTDVGSRTSSFRIGGRTKTVFRDLSDPNVPAKLPALEELVDALADPRWRAVGVSWLSVHQEADGSWCSRTFASRCDPVDEPTCADSRDNQWPSATTTALALLPLAAAHPYESTEENVSQRAALRGLDYLVKAQVPDTGMFPDDGRLGSIAQAWRATALCSYRRGWTNLRYPKSAELAIAALVQMQDQHGSWPGPPGLADAEIISTGWASLALRTADQASVLPDRGRLTMAADYLSEQAEILRASGLQKTGRDGAVRLLRAAAMATCARSWSPEGVKREDPSAAILTGTDMGSIVDATLDPGTAFFVVRAFEAVEPEKRPLDIWPYLKGGKRLNGCRSGSWEPRPEWGFGGGRLYATSMGLLAELAWWNARDLPGHR